MYISIDIEISCSNFNFLDKYINSISSNHINLNNFSTTVVSYRGKETIAIFSERSFDAKARK